MSLGQTLSPIHHIVGFSQIQEDLVPGLLLSIGELLHQLHLHSCCSCAPASQEAMEAVVEFDRKKSFVHEDFHYLPDWLQQPDTSVVPTPFWEEDYHHPSHLLRDAPMLPNGSN